MILDIFTNIKESNYIVYDKLYYLKFFMQGKKLKHKSAQEEYNPQKSKKAKLSVIQNSSEIQHEIQIPSEDIVFLLKFNDYLKKI